LDRLERDNRRWKILGISVVALGMFLLIGATQSRKIIIADTVRAKHFTLLGNDGEGYGFWEAPYNKPNLLFLDKIGRTVVNLSSNPVPSLKLGDRKGRATLSISPNGYASLELYDKGRNKRAVLGSTSLETTDTGTEMKTAESSLVLFDKKGKVIGVRRRLGRGPFWPAKSRCPPSFGLTPSCLTRSPGNL